MNELLKLEYRLLYIQLEFDEMQNDYLNQTLEFLVGVERKKNMFLLGKIYFKRVFS